MLKKSFCLVIFFALSLSACNIFDRPEERVVITVGNKAITEDELRKDIEHIIFEMGITDQEAKLAFRPIIDKVIEKALVMEYGREKGITLLEDELETALNEIEKDYPKDVFKELLLKKYIDYNRWKEGLRQELLVKKIISSAVENMPPITFDETKAYFESHRDEFERPQMVKLRQIVTRSRKDAEMVVGRLAEGHKMHELARKYSIAPEAENGGVLGWIAKGEQEESIDQLIFSLPVGKKSSILKSPYGYHIFEVLDQRDEGLKDLPEAMADIQSKLTFQRQESFYRKWIESLKERFPVSIDQNIYTDWSMEG